MLTIIYNDEFQGECYPDHMIWEKCEKIYQDYKDGWYTEYEVGQELMIEALRVMVAESDINDIQFKFHNQIISMDDQARLGVWPKGFCETMNDYLSRILDVWEKNE